MKEMHGGSSRDDRQKREEQRQEREMAKFAQMYPFAPMAIYFYPLLPLLFWLWVGGQGVNILIFTDILYCHLVSLMSISADAQKQQRLQLQQESGSGTASSESRTATALTDQEQRNTLKFGFSSKGSASKVCPPKKTKIVLLVLGNLECLQFLYISLSNS